MAKSRFSTTRWSVVHRAGGPRSPEARAALEELCARYWYPLYAFLRRSGSRPDEAADLVQGLFASLIERESLTAVDHEMGRFRSWLLGALKHHVVDARKHDAALKRGGGEKVLSIDVEGAETRYSHLRSDSEKPEDLFDRQWAAEVMERAFEGLGGEYQERGQGELFDGLREALLEDRGTSHRKEMAAKLEMEVGTLRVALHRMRMRLRAHLEREVLETIGPNDDLEAEIGHLLGSL